jgi:hypothetical protein
MSFAVTGGANAPPGIRLYAARSDGRDERAYSSSGV